MCAQPDDPSRITLSFHRKKRYSRRTRVCKTRRLTDWLLIRRRRTSIDDNFHVKGERLRSRGYVRQISIRRIYSYAWRPDLSHKVWRSLRIIISILGKKLTCKINDAIVWETIRTLVHRIYWACRSTEYIVDQSYDLAIHPRASLNKDTLSREGTNHQKYLASSHPAHLAFCIWHPKRPPPFIRPCSLPHKRPYGGRA